jgi:DNA-binding transcriptional MerR regulator
LSRQDPVEGPVGLRSGQVAAAAEVNIETLRYYERRGLLAEPDRTPGGHRLYPAETVTMLRVIKAAPRLGFTLEEVDERIADLHTIRETLLAALDAGCDDLVECAGNDCCPIPFATITTRPCDSPNGATPERSLA